LGWHKKRLGEVVTLKRGYDLPASQRLPGAVPVVSSSGVTGTHNEAKAKAPGVVTGRYGTLGEVFYIAEDFWPLNTALYVEDFKGNHPRFIAYFLKQAIGRGSSDKAAVPGINRNDLHARQVLFPSLASQVKIADILSAYDDLIENNRRRIQLLEQSARLLYKEWFVHLRFPGYTHVKIKDGVPEGWEKRQVKCLLAKVQRPLKIKTADYLPFAAIPCIDQSRNFIGGYTDRRESIIDLAKPVIVFGDHTRILKFVDFPFACGADGTQLIVSNDKLISQVYLYFALTALDLSNYFYARHLKFLKDQYIPIPTANLLNHFTENAGLIMKQVGNLRALSQQLVRARDLLLPRLMNGEIAV
jgi:type I restriction enzyme, S subunit